MNRLIPCVLVFFVTVLSVDLLGQTVAYNNYDFIPGEKIIFEDNFVDSQDGEFPPRWNLVAGQPVINKVDELLTLVFGQCDVGAPCKIEPAMKTKQYLGSAFTVEFDFILPTGDECMMLYFRDKDEDDSRHINFQYDGAIKTGYFENELQGIFPNAEENYIGKWHHAALAYKSGQLKVYLDQYRVLVVPQAGFEPKSILLGGCANAKIRNVKVADGGGMNMLGKILTDGKFVSHAIKFDVNKATIKGESMGFLNELSKWLKENGAVKLEIGGHTDSDGDDVSNMKLSQARAEAVKTQLVSMGIDSGRLVAKGYGESKPMDNNSTPEGKANNRRVEFLKF